MVPLTILKSLQEFLQKLSKQESEKVNNSIINFFLLLFKTFLGCNFKMCFQYFLKHLISLAQRAGMEICQS